MKWDHILGEVLFFYLEVFAIYFAYWLSKEWAMDKRSRVNPPIRERILRCVGCLAIVALLALFAAYRARNDGEENAFAYMDYNRGAIAFIALAIPAIIGTTEGLTAQRDHTRPPPPPSSCGDM